MLPAGLRRMGPNLLAWAGSSSEMIQLHDGPFLILWTTQKLSMKDMRPVEDASDNKGKASRFRGGS